MELSNFGGGPRIEGDPSKFESRGDEILIYLQIYWKYKASLTRPIHLALECQRIQL
tara:strand:- start:1157 stop:1324 length:168 start_codon:yes stop_codon:yes gene_type:complete